MYKIKQSGMEAYILRISDNVKIPINHGNTDYQEYLEWVAEGNQPEEADEVK